MSQKTFYRRRALAARLTKLITQEAVGSAVASGVFLTAPRRTGKSTFAREDLRPALEEAGALVLYADLWKDLTKEPGAVIVETVREAIGRDEKLISRLAIAPGLEAVSVGRVNFNVNKIGLGKEIGLTKAFEALSDETKKLIVLIIDETQHAITTDEGVAALFALKAARDELNSSKHYGLRIVCIGSNQSKLATLRNSSDEAFFGASMVQLPMLDKDFIDWYCKGLDLPHDLDPSDVFQLFQESGCRPDLLSAAADDIRFDFTVGPKAIVVRLAELVRAHAEALNANLRTVIHSLTPIQSAVIRVMGSKGEGFAPFESSTMELYAKAIANAGIATSEPKVEEPDVQLALMALQEKKLVWKTSRGVYAIEERLTVDVLRKDGLLDDLV
ncbi:ATP-binding protein [Pseudomonas atacamensis]|uniref:ATP-binding protein n=1 Tax=Pseudomonas atacamensis TaxID=2565368 RepID=UPI002448A631|nr:ATP-binding protein [Pseudomonas atacamensis]MDH2076902.1 ATP-binding protein [Pseudomonas atacamensis]